MPSCPLVCTASSLRGGRPAHAGVRRRRKRDCRRRRRSAALTAALDTLAALRASGNTRSLPTSCLAGTPACAGELSQSRAVSPGTAGLIWSTNPRPCPPAAPGYLTSTWGFPQPATFGTHYKPVEARPLKDASGKQWWRLTSAWVAGSTILPTTPVNLLVSRALPGCQCLPGCAPACRAGVQRCAHDHWLSTLHPATAVPCSLRAWRRKTRLTVPDTSPSTLDAGPPAPRWPSSPAPPPSGS